MLYVFLVGSGTMTTFDMNLACGDVTALKSAIYKQCGIPEEQQVLLVSGGTALNPKSKVIEYSAGTDTNPIFLCTRTGVDYGYGSHYEDERCSYRNVEERVIACESMTCDFQTLATRSQLAQELAQLGNQELTACNQLVDSQHLQHQGWLAVVANLEDELKNLQKSFEMLKNNTQEYFQSRPSYRDLLDTFCDAVNRLERCILLPAFVSSCDDVEKRTLLSKFASEPSSNLKELAGHFHNWTSKFNEMTLDELKQKVTEINRKCAASEMKEISGIEDRLYKLNVKISEAKKLSGEQHRFAKSFINHQNRLSTMSEPSILRDLCLSHNAELRAMLKTHFLLTQIHEQCKKAKMQISMILHQKISDVAEAEGEIFAVKNKIVLCNVNLSRLQDHLGIIQQMHIAPELYVKTLVEIYRRKMFSSDFLKWASSISEFALEVHQREVGARESFKKSKSQNFIDSLFPGMDDIPPPFATSQPEPFDTLLPSVTEEDLENLRKILPEFAAFIDMPPCNILHNTSHKSIGTDSAFSSEVPLSQALTVPSQSCASCHTSHLCRTITLSSSTGGDAVSSQPEISSPASSPLNETVDSESHTKHKPERTKVPSDLAERDLFSPIAEEQNNAESDVEEFETVNSLPKCAYDPFTGSVTLEDTASKQVSSKQRPLSTPDIIVPKSDAKEELRQSTCEERLRSPDSMLTSHDFCSADYFFDDSMPSSYTESTGLSAAGKGQQMVKSHHVIVAELQHQLDNKTSALIGAEGSLPMSRSADIMKLHATLSAFQKLVQDFRSKFTSDLVTLKETVMLQKKEAEDELVSTIQRVDTCITQVRQETEKLQQNAIEEILAEEKRRNEDALERKQIELDAERLKLQDSQKELDAQRLKLQYSQKELDAERLKRQDSQEELDAERLKLQDSQKELAISQKESRQLKKFLTETREQYTAVIKRIRAEHMAEILDFKHDIEMEHELELNSIKGEMNRQVIAQQEEVTKLLEELKEKEAQIDFLNIEKAELEADHQKLVVKEEEWSHLTELIKEDKSMQSEEVEKSSRETYTCDDGVLIIAGPGALQVPPSLIGLHNNALLHALNNEDLYTNLITEIKRIWRTLYEDFEGKTCDTFSRQFVEKINEIVIDLVEQDLLVSELDDDCKDFFTKEPKPNISFLKTIADIEAATMAEQNAEITTVAEASTQNGILVALLNDCMETFRKWGATSVYNSHFLSVVDAEKQSKESEISSLEEKLKIEQDKHLEELEKVKSLHTAENQVAFNEAISRVTREKDEIISSLNSRLAAAEAHQSSYIGMLKDCVDKSTPDSVDTKLMETSPLLHKALVEITKSILQPTPGASSSKSLDSASTSATRDAADLERDLKKERDKLCRIFNKINQAPEIKLSVLSCEPGDCVLFCYNDKCKHYVAFHFGPTPHFLHLDSVKVLELKIPPDSPKTTWAIGIITDKEYYMAKKMPNRFNLKSGSMFYSVRVTPWERSVHMKRWCAGQSDLTVSEVSGFSGARSSHDIQGAVSKVDKMSTSTI